MYALPDWASAATLGSVTDEMAEVSQYRNNRADPLDRLEGFRESCMKRVNVRGLFRPASGPSLFKSPV